MTSSLKHISPVSAELTVEIPQNVVVDALERAYAQLGRSAKIRGFRKGKVPRAVLRRMFGDAVRAEVRGDLVSSHLHEAFMEHKLEPLSQPELDFSELEEDQGYTFTAKFEKRSELEKISLDDIEIETYRIQVNPDEVDRELERFRSGMAEIVELENPRPAEKGDLIKFSIKRWIDGEWKAPSSPSREIVLGETPIEKEVEDILPGMNVGDEKVVDLGSEKEIEEQRIRYMLTIESIKGRKLPELDDEFAKDVGDYETLDALKETISTRLTKAKEQNEQNRLLRAFYDALREKNPMTLPPTLFEQQTAAFQMRVQSSLAALGQEAPGEEEQDAMRERAEKAATEMVHQHLLLLECARIREVEVENSEVDEAIKEFAEERGLPLPMVKAEFSKEGRSDELKLQLLEKKVFENLKPEVKITETDPPTDSAEGDGN